MHRDENQVIGPLSFTVNDVDGDTVTVTASSSNASVVAPGGVSLTGTGMNRSVTVTPVANAPSAPLSAFGSIMLRLVPMRSFLRVYSGHSFIAAKATYRPIGKAVAQLQSICPAIGKSRFWPCLTECSSHSLPARTFARFWVSRWVTR